jgi:hypothetical protein
MVSYDYYPDKYAHFYGYTYERCYGGIFFRQLQFRHYDSVDTVVGFADDVACTCF